MIDDGRLHRLGQDLLRIAGELTDSRDGVVREVQMALPTQDIRAVIRSRRLRGRMFPKALFADPAWDMLLELAACDAEGRGMSITGLCDACCVAPTTGTRWVSALEARGFVERRADPSDRRRSYIRLSERGRQDLSCYITAVSEAALPIA